MGVDKKFIQPFVNFEKYLLKINVSGNCGCVDIH